LTTPAQKLSIRLPQALVLGYVVLILLGTYLLSLPFAAKGAPLGVLDALFTATSAVCVTGLIVVDTATRFSRAGQLVIITLIQIGGLGIMTFSTFLLYVVSGRFSFHGRRLVMETLGTSNLSGLAPLLGSVFTFTVAMQAGGALLLWLAFSRSMPVREAAFHSSFHAVSAFCNAGFSTFSDNLAGFTGVPLVNVVIMVLIVSGGLGFVVITELGLMARNARSRLSGKPIGENSQKVSLHTRVVLTTYGALLLAGLLGFWLGERNHTLAGRTLPDQMMVSAFHSITPRTTGFNTVRMSDVALPTAFMLVLLMFVGAAPGSCGGGIKVSTLGVLLGLSTARLRGGRDAILFRRRLPDPIVSRAVAIFSVSVALVIVAVFILTITERSSTQQLGVSERFLAILFEAVSAFGTVGLSRGITQYLTAAGKLTIVCLMFVGRLGPLNVALAVGRGEGPRYRHPSESLMVG
jgi:trk system potassium uptake protein TrkH